MPLESKPLFEIGASGVDVERIVQEIRARVEERRRRGDYADPSLARAERANLFYLRGQEEFFDLYLDYLRGSCLVDINDFEIVERRARLRPLLKLFKRLLWKLLKFYTYRLWSQQNEINGLLLSAVEMSEARSRERWRELERRLEALEECRRLPARPSPSPGDRSSPPSSSS